MQRLNRALSPVIGQLLAKNLAVLEAGRGEPATAFTRSLVMPATACR